MFFQLASSWGPIRQLRTPLTAEREHAPPPQRGEHTDAILADAGYDTAAIAELHAQRVVG